MARRKRKKYMWICLLSSDLPYRAAIEKALWGRTSKVEISYYPSKIPVYRIPVEEREKFEVYPFIEGSEEFIYDRILHVKVGNQSIGLVLHRVCALDYLVSAPFISFKLKKTEGSRARVRRKVPVMRRRRRKQGT